MLATFKEKLQTRGTVEKKTIGIRISPLIVYPKYTQSRAVGERSNQKPYSYDKELKSITIC